MTEISDRHLNAFKNFLESLPHGKDIELVLLKGHLLIEEQIRQIIHSRLRNPGVFAEANSQLGAHQAIQLAKAFFPPAHMPEIWKATLKLNQLRNDIAHNLWSKMQLSDKVAAWVKIVPSSLTAGPDAQQNFELALWSLFEAISSLVDQPFSEVVASRQPEGAD
jgi:hypothetical protein